MENDGSKKDNDDVSVGGRGERGEGIESNVRGGRRGVVRAYSEEEGEE
jgi:hypothetical protein